MEELEKQLQKQEESSVPSNKNQSSSNISKSLYERVLNSGARNFSPKNRYTSIFSRLNSRNVSTENTEPNSATRTNSENKYSSVIRNSRPSPQNDGLEELSDYQGLFRDKPQYVTINRNSNKHRRQESNESNQDDDDVNANIDEDDDVELIQSTLTTPPSKYVNIQRGRPQTTTTTTEKNGESKNDKTDEDDEKSTKTESLNRRQYGALNRRRPASQQAQDDNDDASVTTSR